MAGQNNRNPIQAVKKNLAFEHIHMSNQAKSFSFQLANKANASNS